MCLEHFSRTNSHIKPSSHIVIFHWIPKSRHSFTKTIIIIHLWIMAFQMDCRVMGTVRRKRFQGLNTSLHKKAPNTDRQRIRKNESNGGMEPTYNILYFRSWTNPPPSNAGNKQRTLPAFIIPSSMRIPLYIDSEGLEMRKYSMRINIYVHEINE